MPSQRLLRGASSELVDKPEPSTDRGDHRAQTERIHARAEHAQHGRQERQAEDDRAQHDQRAGDPDRRDGRRHEEQQAQQADSHGDAREGDGLAGGADRDLDCVADVPAAPQLLAETTDQEQRVIDGQRQAEHRRHVDDVDAHLGPRADEEDHRQRRGNGQQEGDYKRQRRRHD